MLTQFAPSVEKGDIANLPRYQFYIKISALEPEEPFSGKTLLVPVERDQAKIDKLIQASRSNYAIEYHKQQATQKKFSVQEKTPVSKKAKERNTVTGTLPENR